MKTIKVMTIDDSHIMRKLIRYELEKLNITGIHFIVYEATDGLDALSILERFPDVSIIFLDWNMPNMNGEEFVSKVRDDNRYDKIKIIMATTENTKEKVSGILKKGINGYLVKPFDPSKIATIVKQLVARL